MTHMPSPDTFHPQVLEAARRACRLIPPAWPLSATVAVNPFLGHTTEPLAMVAARLERIGGPRPLMPRAWYRERLEAGEIADADLDAACAALDLEGAFDAASLRAKLAAAPAQPEPIPTVADLVAAARGIPVATLAPDRIGAWAQAWFDEGQAMWRPSKASGAFVSWREFATHDLVPEIEGLAGFCRFVTGLPATATAAVADCLSRLGVEAQAVEPYAHQLLLRLGGWAQAARLPAWKAEQEGRQDDTLLALLAGALAFEAALLETADEATADRWLSARKRHAAPVEPSEAIVVDCILQAALEEAGRRKLAGRLAAPRVKPVSARPAVKAYFCIDVRSEPFRRALETQQVETGGFAGFFGLGVAHRRFGSTVAENRLPVLLSPRMCTQAGGPEDEERAAGSRIAARARRALGRFSAAAVASFAYVEAAGLGYAARLAASAFLPAAPAGKAEPAPVLPGLSAREKGGMAASVLRGMSLTADFPRLALLVGHGAAVTNNPFASALHCGACGGHAGDVNARLLASLLNDPETRAELAAAGIAVPETTLFVAGLHDTTSDMVTLYEDHLPAARAAEIADLRSLLGRASLLARTARCARLPGASGESDLRDRGADWSEVRPEWGLAGCQAFIAAPRAVTAGVDLGGRAFLHDYDWHRDDGFGVLELILTAPVVVASWISLQYYGSTVAPQAYGSGNKLLHNVVGGIGVIEGNGGPLRTGLPWQSVHDGKALAHEPLRLTVMVAAPAGAIAGVLARHPGVRDLFDKGWLALVALGEDGRPAARYCGDLAWTVVADG